jgi:hypothetical protein
VVATKGGETNAKPEVNIVFQYFIDVQPQRINP